MKQLPPWRHWRAIRHPAIREIRGKGLLIGLELDPPWISARKFCEELMRNGILSKETHETVIRFAPPLTITYELMDRAVEIFRKVVVQKHRELGLAGA